MKKIRGQFAPITSELGYDDRFKLELTDFERLMYLLIVHTCHMTHHRAPRNPQYYKLQYGLNARKSQIEAATNTLIRTFPKLRCSEGKLSLLNSTTYKSQNALEVEEEVEVDIGNKKSKSSFTKPTLEELKVTFREKGFPAEAERFFDYYESYGWMVGKNKMKNWNAAVANWIRQGRSYGKIAPPKPKPKPKPDCNICKGAGKLPDINAYCHCVS